MPKTQDRQEPSDILIPKECAALLRTSVGWIYGKTRGRQRDPLPCFRIGRYIRFSRADVLAWMRAHANGPARKIAKAAR